MGASRPDTELQPFKAGRFSAPSAFFLGADFLAGGVSPDGPFLAPAEFLVAGSPRRPGSDEAIGVLGLGASWPDTEFQPFKAGRFSAPSAFFLGAAFRSGGVSLGGSFLAPADLLVAGSPRRPGPELGFSRQACWAQ